jgi:hypothetical protein
MVYIQVSTDFHSDIQMYMYIRGWNMQKRQTGPKGHLWNQHFHGGPHSGPTTAHQKVLMCKIKSMK